MTPTKNFKHPYSCVNLQNYKFVPMTNKHEKPKARESVKTINLTDDFLVHELAKKPYQLFCELFFDETLVTNTRLISSKKPYFEVIHSEEKVGETHKDVYHFFEDFRLASQVDSQSSITVRKSNLTNTDIARRAWQYLFNEFLSLEPINPVIYQAIKEVMPESIQLEIFQSVLTIEIVLDLKNIKRYKYDHQVSRYRDQQSTEIPSFPELIDEVRNADSK